MSGDSQDPITFLPLGAIVQSFRVADRDIVLGFPTQKLYEDHNAPYFGETIGRVANRVSGARIEGLRNGSDGAARGGACELRRNDEPNSLHGGEKGFGKRMFRGPEAVTTAADGGSSNIVLFTYESANGEEGYPGRLQLSVLYTTRTSRKQNRECVELEVEYQAELLDDGEDIKETVVAITNHSYFNLAGTPTITGTRVQLFTNQYLEVDSTGIPTGLVTSFPGIQPEIEFILGDTEPDIDHCFIVNQDPRSIPVDTRALPLSLLASFREAGEGSDDSGMHLEVYSTEPAFQFYTGKYIDVPALPDFDLPARGPRSGFCVEPGRYVNAVNHEGWRNMVLLKRGEVYGSKILYKAWKT